MKCEYVARLLPLHAGRDLDEKRSCLVAAHLQSCTQCFRAANEYARANQLLQRFEAPYFSDEIYAGIRRQVLSEIERQSQTPSWSRAVSQFLAPFVHSPVSWTTAALLLALSVVALYFNINRSTRLPYNQQVADGARSPADNRANFQLEHASATSPSRSLAPARAGSTGKKVVNAGRRSTKRKEAVAVARHGMLTPRTLRVEMQTRDRNIRIIWLGSQPPQAGEKETAKGI
jgi:anti-sigma factor RsiW